MMNSTERQNIRFFEQLQEYNELGTRSCVISDTMADPAAESTDFSRLSYSYFGEVITTARLAILSLDSRGENDRAPKSLQVTIDAKTRFQ